MYCVNDESFCFVCIQLKIEKLDKEVNADAVMPLSAKVALDASQLVSRGVVCFASEPQRTPDKHSPTVMEFIIFSCPVNDVSYLTHSLGTK